MEHLDNPTDHLPDAPPPGIAEELTFSAGRGKVYVRWERWPERLSGMMSLDFSPALQEEMDQLPELHEWLLDRLAYPSTSGRKSRTPRSVMDRIAEDFRNRRRSQLHRLASHRQVSP
jgi:hypothetical protein